MSNILEATVLETHHWTDNLFTIKATRDPGFRFQSGQFAMVGLQVDGKPLMRAYSMVNASYDEYLEFLSIKVPNGPLTSRLQHIKAGDTILVNRKTTGTLILDNLLPGNRLYLIATGTGLAPFLSIIKDPVIYDRFDQIILTHTCRYASELVYDQFIQYELAQNEYFGEYARDKLVYYPSVTREEFKNQGRITDLVRSGTLFNDLGVPAFDKESDRVMICGNPHMMTDLSHYLDGLGFTHGHHGVPGHYVIEKAFAEK
jgi:ferredoxin--NADP+ reductase